MQSKKCNELDFSKSKEVFNRIKDYIPGGVNSWTRSPIYFKKAQGSRIWDIDGNEFIDLLCNWGACILGHNYPPVVDFVKKQLENGLTVSLETELTTQVAKKINQLIPSAECVKFSNTGSEAVLHAIQISRGYTGKNKLIKLEGGMNGWIDFVSVSTAPKLNYAGDKKEPNSVLNHLGINKNIAESTFVMPFNDIDASLEIIKKHKNEVAAVIMEPVMFTIGCVPAKKEYLKAIREITEDLGIVLIFDEIITGFRIAPGGAQQYYNITPDLTTLGKAIANGFPISAVAGKKEFMKLTDPASHGSKPYIPFGGTYNGNQIGVSAAKATLDTLEDGKVQKYLHESTTKIASQFEAIAEDLKIEAHIQQIAGKFQVYLTDQEIVDYRTTLKYAGTEKKKKMFESFSRVLFNSGLYWLPSWGSHRGITAAHDKKDIETIIQTISEGLKAIK